MTTAGMTGTTLPDAAPQRRQVTLLGAITRWNDARLTRLALRRLGRHQLGDLGIDDPEVLIRP